ncbi:MAG: secretin N-terminal domain-containing protein [Sulfuritalea sp.]|nr:secretin N-terminal domain-containing protein [Sulfuritalea sp.]
MLISVFNSYNSARGTRLRPFLIPPSYLVLFSSLVLAACGGLQPQPPSAGHIRAEGLAAPNPDIPPPVANTVMLARPKAAAKTESYSVSVRNIPVQDLLFALARDAKLNVDIHSGITGVVTVNAIDQTLQQILSRIAKQVDMRWEIDGPNLIVMPDSPFLRNYKVDYVNMSRDATGTNSINTSIASTSSGATGGASTGGGGNNSTTTVTSKAKNEFWVSLEKNLQEILRETDKILPEGSSETVIERSDQQATTGTGGQGGQAGANRGAGTTTSLAGSPNAASLQQQGTTVVKRVTFREAASIIVNADAGVVVVRATSRQHEKVQDYLDMTLTSARRQVIIEATIAEVRLNDQYQQGIQWSSLRSMRPGPPTAGFSMLQRTGGGVITPVLGAAEAARGTLPFVLNYVSPGLGIIATLSLLETFGNVKVLSSPKMSVLNNQTAMLKVVDNLVYFNIKTDSAVVTGNSSFPPVQTATAQTVAVGLVMSVTPQISENGSILLNVRPSISRKFGEVEDPTNPVNKVPIIQTREMESMLRLADGEIAVMGGLMSDELNNTTDTIPGISKFPALGLLFNSHNDTTTKTELVILLKPTVIRDPSINGDYRSFRDQLPARNFFGNNPGREQQQVDMQGAAPQ